MRMEMQDQFVLAAPESECRGMEAYNAISLNSTGYEQSIKDYLENVNAEAKRKRVKIKIKPLPAELGVNVRSAEDLYKHKRYNGENIMTPNSLILPDEP
jgi:hypothetical protein